MVKVFEMAGPPSQGWSKFATNYNSGSTSDPNGRPWTMPADRKAKLVEEQSLVDKDTTFIQKEKKKLWEFEEEIVSKEKWIKKAEHEIKTAVAAVNGQCFRLDFEQDITKEKEEEYRKRNAWVIEEKKFPLEFPE
ncbi:hypothetical protein LXL04_029648 [Taraxacum kok-saghyz]